MKKLEISVFLGLILSVIISLFLQTNLTAHAVRSETLRLHIIANSNSEYDQNIKLLIRDEILVLSSEIIADSENIDSAINTANDNLELIQSKVNDYLIKKDIPYTATISVENFYFETTSYEDFTLPQGEYPALTVRLGEAKGNNWWCVVYPSLCVSMACEIDNEKYENKDVNEFINNDDIQIKFKSVEIFEDVKSFLLNEDYEIYDKT